MAIRRNSHKDRQKSLVRRFLFILGVFFFMMYLVLGLMIIFWKGLPYPLTKYQRWGLGGLLIVYSFFRFIRLLQTSRDDE